jgi:hypothetical protein
MLGEKSKYAAECYEGEFIGIWYKINEDLMNYLKDKEKFEEKIIPILIEDHSKYNKDGNEREDRNKEQSAELIAPQIWAFWREMQIGDIVICPTGKKFNSYHVGEIKSNYYFKRDYFKKDGEMQPHRRDIEWFSKKIFLNDMSENLKKILKKHGTVVDLNKDTDEIQKELKELLDVVICFDQNTSKINSITYKDKKEDNLNENDIILNRYTEYLLKYLNQSVIGLLVQYLNKMLPNISNNWWKKIVFEKLKPYQQKRIKRNNIDSLDGLDLPELLLIIDNNWYDISQECSFFYDDRNIVKEMISVRNRVSHLSNNGYNSLGNLLRDFDTMRRFLLLIDIKQKDIQKTVVEIQEILLDIMHDIISSSIK